MFGTVFGILAAILLGVVIWKIGVAMTRSLTTPLPAPPPEGEMRKINLRYRCSMCGVEIRMTRASEELPEPPRHCQEDMDLVAPVE